MSEEAVIEMKPNYMSFMFLSHLRTLSLYTVFNLAYQIICWLVKNKQIYLSIPYCLQCAYLILYYVKMYRWQQQLTTVCLDYKGGEEAMMAAKSEKREHFSDVKSI